MDMGEEGFAVGGLAGEVHEVGDGFAGEAGFAVAGDDVVGDDADFVGSAEAGEEEGTAAKPAPPEGLPPEA